MALFYAYLIFCLCLAIWGWWKRRAVLGKNDAEFMERIMNEHHGQALLSSLCKSRFISHLSSGVFIFFVVAAINYLDDPTSAIFCVGASVASYVSAASDDAKIKMYYLPKNMMDKHEVKPS